MIFVVMQHMISSPPGDVAIGMFVVDVMCRGGFFSQLRMWCSSENGTISSSPARAVERPNNTRGKQEGVCKKMLGSV